MEQKTDRVILSEEIFKSISSMMDKALEESDRLLERATNLNLVGTAWIMDPTIFNGIDTSKEMHLEIKKALKEVEENVDHSATSNDSDSQQSDEDLVGLEEELLTYPKDFEHLVTLRYNFRAIRHAFLQTYTCKQKTRQ